MDSDLLEELKTVVKGYKVPPQAIELLKEHMPLVITGVSASGKNAVVDYLMMHHRLKRVVTHTTRTPRAYEVNGVDYWFVSPREMLELISNKAMVECQFIHGHTFYGTSVAAYHEVVSAKLRPVMEIDVQGLNKIAQNIIDLKAFFIVPPTFKDWMERFDNRGAMSEDERRNRLRSATIEIESALNSQHFQLLINREISDTAKAILTENHSSADEILLARKIAEKLVVEANNF